MNLPKVKFTDIPLSKEVDWIHGFLFQNEWGWGKYIIKKHPKIKRVFSLKTEVEQVKFLKKYIIELRKDKQKVIEKNKEKYQKEWRKIEKEYFEILSKIIQIDWPKNKKTIKAMVSVNPICPRFLKDWSFSIFYNYKKISHAIEVIMHESCHFLYFEKWKEFFPDSKTKTFDYPYIEWHLSEIIAPIILNDRRIQKYLKHRAVFYEEHNKIKINGIPANKYFSNLYFLYLKNNKSFEDFIKETHKIIKKNKDLFLVFKNK